MENKKVTYTETYVNINCDSGIETPIKHREILEKEISPVIVAAIDSGEFNGELKKTIKLGRDIVPEEDPIEGLKYTIWWAVEEKIEI